jgi:hypothetical protein
MMSDPQEESFLKICQKFRDIHGREHRSPIEMQEWLEQYASTPEGRAFLRETVSPERTDEELAEEYREAQAQQILDLFEEAKGRPACTLEEVSEWADTPEGKEWLALGTK